jgi:hypothetical protein
MKWKASFQIVSDESKYSESESNDYMISRAIYQILTTTTRPSRQAQDKVEHSPNTPLRDLHNRDLTTSILVFSVSPTLSDLPINGIRSSWMNSVKVRLDYDLIVT